MLRLLLDIAPTGSPRHHRGGARRWRMKLALRGVVRVLAVGVRPCSSSPRTGCEWARFTPASILVARVALVVTLVAVGLLVPGPAAARSGHRRAGGALPRGARAVAAGDAAQRGRSRAASGTSRSRRRSSRRVVEQAIEACARLDAARRVEQRRCARYAPSSPAWPRSRCWRVAARSGVLPPRAVRDAAGVAERRGRGRRTASRSSPATPRCRRAPTRRSPRSCSASTSEDVVADGAARRRPATFEPLPLVRNDERHLRGHDLRRQRAARVLRRGRRRAVADLHAEGRRRAVRAAARARIPLPGLHRARAAEDRGRRRHRGAARHRRQRHDHPDDEDDGRADCAERQGAVDADAAGRRHADGVVQGRHATASTASSSRRRTASTWRRRRSTRSTCSTDSAPTVSFKRPGRDTSVSPIEEVFVEANAEDDYGVTQPRAGLLGERRAGEGGEAVQRHASGCPR